VITRDTRYKAMRILVEQFIITVIALVGTAVLVRIGMQIRFVPSPS
jgi:hypothetical protein